jgi:plastocyanin
MAVPRQGLLSFCRMKPFWTGILALGVVGSLSALPRATGSVAGRVQLLRNGEAQTDAADAVVWIEGLRAAKEPGTAAATMTSDHKHFVPRVVAVSVGETVAFPNQDPIFHNVFSVSAENRFDLGLYRRGRSREKLFELPGLVRVYCNIHPQMVGYVRVVDSRFRLVTGHDGVFAFDGVPAGPQKLRAWSEEGGETESAINVRAGGRIDATLTLEASAFKSQPHKNKYGQDYPPPPADEDRY